MPKAPDKDNLEKETSVLAHSLQGSVLGLMSPVLRARGETEHHGGGCGRGELLSSWQSGSSKCKRGAQWSVQMVYLTSGLIP